MASRPAIRSAVRTAGVAGLVGVLTPIWLVDRGVSQLRTRGRPDGDVRAIDRVELGQVDDLAAIMDEGRPVVIRDLYERLDLTVRPDLEGLRTVAPTTPFRVHRHRASAPYFLYVGDYGAERLSSDDMTIGPFLDELWAGSDETVTYKLFAIDALDGGIGDIVREMAEQLQAWSGRKADPRFSGIWIGSTGATTPLHHDAWTGLLFQPVGSKRVVMYGPEDRRNIYFSSPFAPTSRWSELPARSRETDDEAYPRFRRARRYETVLEEGETLFIPPFWAHEIEALEPNVSIPFRFATRRRDHLNPGFLRPAVEVLHNKVTADR